MVVRKALILILPLLLAACAQVGFITGGERDIYAPAPEEMMPPNKSVQFTGNSFEITFNEFVQLNNPLQNVVIVPDHAKLKTTLHHKTVRVDWEETLKSNTTYVVYFNGAIKDVTENNDSLMTYVFSTGPVIDSITYSVRVIDAFTNELLPNVTVGLFTDPDQDKPYYFGKTDASGIAAFSFIGVGSYYLKAFQDVNTDLRIQGTEAIAFRKEALELTSSVQDSVPLRLFSPAEQPNLVSLKVQAPGALLLEATTAFSTANFSINGVTLAPENIKFKEEKKALLFTDLKTLGNAEVVVSSSELTDTLSIRLTERDKTAKIQPIPLFSGGKISSDQALGYEVNDRIVSLDTTLLTLLDPDDSSRIELKGIQIEKNTFSLDFDRTKHKRVELTIQKGAIRTITGSEQEEFKSTPELLSERDLGILHIDATGYNEPILIELLLEKSVVKRISLSEIKKTDFNQLLPGDYKIRVVTDVNQNGKWDVGNQFTGSQPERVDWFSVPKIRANWEVDVLLSPER